jgi:hypothetical protein
VALQVKADHHTARARVATAGEKPELWRIMTATGPPYDEFQATPVEGEAGTGSCPWATSRLTTLRPMSPVPPMTTIFITLRPFLLSEMSRISDDSECETASQAWQAIQV